MFRKEIVMNEGKQRPASTRKQEPQRQTGEDRGPIKSRQLKENTVPERSDKPRGSEPETRSAAGPRGGGSGRS